MVNYRNIHLLCAVLFLSVLAYSGTFSNGFVFDDNFQVLQNRWITDPSSVKKVFFSSVWDFEGHGGSISYNSYRPLIHVAYMSVYGLFGLSPAAFHALNIILHALNSGLVFIMASLLISKAPGADNRPYGPALSFFAAAIFALHPAGAEAVSWVACVTELLYTLFFLLSFLAFTGTDKRRAPLLSAAFFFIALLSKETALALPVVIWAYDRCGLEDGPKRTGIVMRYGPFAVAIAVYMLLRAYALGGMAPGQSKHPYLNAFQVFLNMPQLMSGYVKFLVFPSDLTVFHVFEPVFGLSDSGFLVPAAIVAAMAFAFVKTFRSDRHMFLSLTLMVAPLLPVMYIPGIGRNPFAERYMYLPVAGFAMALLYLSDRLLQKAGVRRAWSSLALLATAVVAIYAFIVTTRVPDWRDDGTLWMSAVEQNTANYYAMNELAGLLLERKAYDEAADIARRSVEINSARTAPDTRILGRAHFTIATALRLKAASEGKNAGLMERAVHHYKEALKGFKAKSDLKAVYNDLGACQMAMGRADDAVRSFEAAILAAPDDKILLRNLQIALKATVSTGAK